MVEYLAARGAVVRTAGGPVEVADIEVPLADGDEVTLAVEACGLCHSDLHYIDGESGADFPYLLGHEVAGRVIHAGDNVRDVPVGARAVVALMNFCGTCPPCRRGRPLSCVRKMIAARPPRLRDGTTLTPVLGAGGLADYITVNRQHIVVVDRDLPPPLMAVLGCGVPTGFGAATNTAGIRHGDRVAVIGAGGVGLSAIAGARAAGAVEVVVIDRLESKLQEAVLFGASEVCIAGDAPATTGFDVVIDAVGGPQTLSLAVRLAGTGGTVVMAGAPAERDVADFPMRDLFLKKIALVVSHWGDCVPERDLAAIVALHAKGELPIERYVTETVALEQVGAAYERLRAGQVLRSVVLVEDVPA